MKVSRHSCTVLRRVAKRCQWLWYTCAVDVSRCLKLYSFHSILFYLSNVGANVSRVDSYVLYLSSEKEDRNLLSRKHSSEGIMDLYSFAFLSTRVISRCGRATTARKCTKKRDARGSTCKVVLLIYALLFNCSRCSRRRGCLKKVPDTPRDYKIFIYLNYSWGPDTTLQALFHSNGIQRCRLYSEQVPRYKDCEPSQRLLTHFQCADLARRFRSSKPLKRYQENHKRVKQWYTRMSTQARKKAINFESVTLRGSASQRQKGKNWIIYLNPEPFSRFS